MTFSTGENPINFRYRVYLKDEMIAATSLLAGAEELANVIARNTEYAGSYVMVKDTYQNDTVIIKKEGGSELKKSADILPFTPRT